MNLGEVKQLLYEMVVKYHPGAMVVWEKTNGVVPKPPYITLGCNNLERSLFTWEDEEGTHKYYNYSFTFEINLYTTGREVKVNGGGSGAYENTALEDLEEFVRFLDSPKTTDELAESGVTVLVNPPIRDLSELTGDPKFKYRSMAEFMVAFTGEADGQYGVSGRKEVPNPSGGGMNGMVEADIEGIEEIEIGEII